MSSVRMWTGLETSLSAAFVEHLEVGANDMTQLYLAKIDSPSASPGQAVLDVALREGLATFLDRLKVNVGSARVSVQGATIAVPPGPGGYGLGTASTGINWAEQLRGASVVSDET